MLLYLALLSATDTHYLTASSCQERSFDRHVYANPFVPGSCFFFNLGIRILSCPHAAYSDFVVGDEFSKGEGNSSKGGAYGNWLRSSMRKLDEPEQIAFLGGIADEFGTHGNRKVSQIYLHGILSNMLICIILLLQYEFALGCFGGHGYITRRTSSDIYAYACWTFNWASSSKIHY